MRVLFIDDNELQHFLVKSEIEDEGLPINPSFAFSGEEALKFLELLEIKGEEFPSIIVVDVLMPVSTGFEFVEQYEEEYLERYPDTKIYYLTHKPLHFSVETLSTPSVNGFLQKPFSKAMFQDMQTTEGFIDLS